MPRPSPYIRPYGPNAPWNRSVAQLGGKAAIIHPNSAHYASNLWNNGGVSVSTSNNMRFNTFTYPVYYATDATGTYNVNCSSGNMDGRPIPFNPAWQPSPGSDGQLIVLDPSNGYEYNLGVYTGITTTVNCTYGNLIQTGQSATWGSPASYFTKENGYSPTRGIGIQQLAMLVQPEEVTAGAIRHALSMPVMNPATASSHGAGVGSPYYDDFPLGYVAPATKLEHTGSYVATDVPEGMRFAIDITDAQIDTFVNSRPSGQRTVYRAVAVALRDYGWFITDTSGGAGVQMECWTSASALWSALGVPSATPAMTLTGLMTSSNIYTIVPSDQYPPPGGGGSPTDQKNQRGLLAGVNRGVLRGVV